MQNNDLKELNGVLCVKKPSGFTSFDVIAKLRGILKYKKIGHGGTLDPMATGVLPLFLGKATKAIDFVCCHDKEYTAKIKFGIKTDTLDITGNVIETKLPSFSLVDLTKALEMFRGNILQIPPMFSAVKINGKRLYSLARGGIEIERAPRCVSIYELNLINFDPQKYEAELFISCSKGTYIRQIAEDLGNYLDCGAILITLERNSALGFSLNNCLTINEIENIMENSRKIPPQDNIENYIIKTEKLFTSFEKIFLSEIQSRMFLNGVKLDVNRINLPLNNFSNDTLFTIYGVNNTNSQFLGLAKINTETQELISQKQF